MAPQRGSQQGKAPARKPAKLPVSAHPAFPLIVGLWFGALFGLGSMVMPSIVLEPFFGLLGAGTRATIALGATVLGVVAGLVLARRVAAAQHVARTPRRRASVGREMPARRPISAHEELGRDRIASPTEPSRPPLAGRRRSLTVAEEELPSEYLNYVPLPGGDQGWSQPAPESAEVPAEDHAMTHQPIDDQPFSPPAPADDALDLSGFAPDRIVAAVAPTQPPAGAQVFGGAPVAPPVPEPVVEPAPAEAPAFNSYVPEFDTAKPRAFAAPAAPEPVEDVAAAPAAPSGLETLRNRATIDDALENLGLVELLERFGRSLQRRPVEAPVAAEAPAGEPAEALPFAAPSFDPPLADDSLAVPPPVVPAGLQAFMDEPEAEAAEPALPADEPEVPLPVVPEALRPFAFDPHDDHHDDEAHDPGPFTLPLGSMSPRPFDGPGAGEPVAAADEEPEDETDALPEAEGDYSSLLAMKNPFRPREEFVRIDEPEPEDEAIEPAVVFPGQEPRIAEPEPVAEAEAPAARAFDAPHQPAPSTAPVRARHSTDPAETERALKSALANLQRMSGAA